MKLEDFVLDRRLERIEQVLEKRSSQLTIVLDEVRNEHNISAVIRSADAFGITEVHLIGKDLRLSPGISLGAERWVETKLYDSATSLVEYLEQRSFTLTLVEPEDKQQNSLPVFELPFEKKLALVFGNEHRGVSPELAARATLKTHIPMRGFVESLNISVAAAICLYSSTLPPRKLPPLGEVEREMLRKSWLKKSIRESDAIEAELKKRK